MIFFLIVIQKQYNRRQPQIRMETPITKCPFESTKVCVQSGSTPSNIHSQLYDRMLGDRKKNPLVLDQLCWEIKVGYMQLERKGSLLVL
jgi:hypothetical protein